MKNYKIAAILMLIMGAIYGLIRITGAIGLWKGRMWDLVLSVINCIITLALMMLSGQRKTYA